MSDLTDAFTQPITLTAEQLAQRPEKRRPRSTAAPAPDFSGTEMEPSQRQAERQTARLLRRPQIPTGVALPASTRGALENYDKKLAAYDEAQDALQQIRDEQAAAEQRLRLMRIEAADGDGPMPQRATNNYSQRLADAQDVLEARRVAHDRAAAEVERSFHAAAGEMYLTAEAQANHDRDVAAAKLAEYEAAQQIAVESAGTAAHIAAAYLSKRIPQDVILYRIKEVSEPSSADGRWLREVVEHAGIEHVSKAIPARSDQIHRWLESSSEMQDQIVRFYLEPYLTDETPADAEPSIEEPEPKPAKGKAKGTEGVTGVDI